MKQYIKGVNVDVVINNGSRYYPVAYQKLSESDVCNLCDIGLFMCYYECKSICNAHGIDKKLNAVYFKRLPK